MLTHIPPQFPACFKNCPLTLYLHSSCLQDPLWGVLVKETATERRIYTTKNIK